jgi:hypothetical protein
MKYRAILLTKMKLERPIQHFSNDLVHMHRWTRYVLNKYPEDRIEVYETHEVLIETLYPEEFSASE